MIPFPAPDLSPTDADCLDWIHVLLSDPDASAEELVGRVVAVLEERGYELPPAAAISHIAAARPDGMVPADLAEWHPFDRFKQENVR